LKEKDVDQARLHRLESGPGLFCDGTRRYDVPPPFFESKENIICNVYYWRI